MSEHRYTNALIESSSPYLLQHAHNPVNWYPWSKEALDKAQAEDKLLVISIGYAACHWCHVMEHESFEDTTVAKVMNAHFVSIKVDREERPDIDNLYMQAATLLTGRGGWPLNAIALPDGRPVYAGTYFPRDQWIKALQYYSNLYQHQREALVEQAEKVSQGIQEVERVPLAEAPGTFTPDQLDALFHTWRSRIDFTWGGRNGAPKFPMPDNWHYLLHYHFYRGQPQAKQAVHTTLIKMAQGGIYDQLGGGFARYAVDGLWKVPHFEKMLYDNGQLLSLYSQAYASSKLPLYRQVVAQTIEFLVRELRDPSGGFYASLDADSEGEEGKYYVWTLREIKALTGDAAQLLEPYYNLKPGGNFEAGKNVLFVTHPLDEVAQALGIPEAEARQQLEAAHAQLWAAREKRVRPGLDDKILTSWNALTLQGLTDAYTVFGQRTYLHLALENARFLSDHLLQSDHRLYRNYKNGQASINAFLDDYALLAKACISLYQATFDEEWLHKAHGLVNYVQAHFADTGNQLFYYTSDLDDPLMARQVEISDNVIPASNSVMAEVLWTLGHLLGDPTYLAQSAQMVANLADQLQQQPPFFSRWAKVQLLHTYPPFEVALVGPKALEFRLEMGQTYAPDVLYLGSLADSDLPLLAGKYRADTTQIFVCRDKVCHRPVATVAEAWEEIQRLRVAP